MIKSFLHDIFISYPSPLNRTPYVGWVDKFELALRNALEELCRSRNSPDIYFDKSQVEANSLHEEMLEKAARSRLFVAIVSPDYQERPWAPRELDAFAREAGYKQRLFVIATKPLGGDEVRLNPLRGRTPTVFYSGTAGTPDKTMPYHPESREFQDGVYALARSIAAKLDEIREGETRATAPTPAITNRGAGTRTILLAHVTDDLDGDVRSVLSELGQHCGRHDIVLLSGADYPLGGDAFKTAFEADLDQTDLVVQLLSDTLGKRPRDLPQGYVLYQAGQAAARPGVKLVQWRRSNIDAQAVEDENLRLLLQGEAVTASTLESFKDQLIEWMRSPPRKVKKNPSPGGAQIFINAEKADWDAALECEQALRDLCAAVWLRPEGNPETQSIQKELESLVEDCDSLLFLNGSVESVWVSRQVRQAVKTRAKSNLPMHGALCDGPPVPKPGFHGTVPGIEPINCKTSDGQAWQFDDLRDFVRRNSGLSQ